MWCKTSMVLIIAVVCCAFIVAATQTEFENVRPVRPAYFNSYDEAKDYIAKLKEYIRLQQTGGRYGKRSSLYSKPIPYYLARPNVIY